MIMENCAINLHILDIFAKNSNMSYQRDFARILRRTLSKIAPGSSDTGGDLESSWAESEGELLDPELLQYRWIAGSNGLWR